MRRVKSKCSQLIPSLSSALRRLKRDTTKLTPADMLALVALVEAGERARKESDVDSGISVPLSDGEEMDYVPSGSWLDAPVALPATSPVQQQQQAQPALIDYYGIPVEAQVVPKYEYLQRPQKYIGGNSREYAEENFDLHIIYVCVFLLLLLQASDPRSVSWSPRRSVPSARASSSTNQLVNVDRAILVKSSTK